MYTHIPTLHQEEIYANHQVHEIRCIKRKTKYISTHMRVFSYYTARPYMYSALIEGEIANR